MMRNKLVNLVTTANLMRKEQERNIWITWANGFIGTRVLDPRFW